MKKAGTSKAKNLDYIGLGNEDAAKLVYKS